MSAPLFNVSARKLDTYSGLSLNIVTIVFNNISSSGLSTGSRKGTTSTVMVDGLTFAVFLLGVWVSLALKLWLAGKKRGELRF